MEDKNESPKFFGSHTRSHVCHKSKDTHNNHISKFKFEEHNNYERVKMSNCDNFLKFLEQCDDGVLIPLKAVKHLLKSHSSQQCSCTSTLQSHVTQQSAPQSTDAMFSSHQQTHHQQPSLDSMSIKQSTDAKQEEQTTDELFEDALSVACSRKSLQERKNSSISQYFIKSECKNSNANSSSNEVVMTGSLLSAAPPLMTQLVPVMKMEDKQEADQWEMIVRRNLGDRPNSTWSHKQTRQFFDFLYVWYKSDAGWNWKHIFKEIKNNPHRWYHLKNFTKSQLQSKYGRLGDDVKMFLKLK